MHVGLSWVMAEPTGGVALEKGRFYTPRTMNIRSLEVRVPYSAGQRVFGMIGPSDHMCEE